MIHASSPILRRRTRSDLGAALVAGLIAASVAGVAAGCSPTRHASAPTTSTASTTPVTSTTAPGPQTSGPRTVLSPIGLHVRQGPSRTARVLGTAAQGVELTVLGYTGTGGGWFKVKGATVTGWISAQPTLSAPGAFQAYTSAEVSALYPDTWRAQAVPPGSARVPTTSVLFRPPAGAGDIVATAAGSLAQLPHGRPGYGLKSVSQVVVCGVTAGLVVFRRTGSGSTSLAYLAEVRFAVDKAHALGLYADLPDLGPTFQIFMAFVASVTFSAPQCTG
jgi:hypothetical protein